MTRGGMAGPARRAAFVAAALAAAAAAPAQTVPEVPSVISPLRVETDHNGVNLVTGKTQIRIPALTTPAAPNLRFDYVQNSAPYVRGTISGGGGANYSTASFSIHTGGGSESFTCVDYDCTSATLSGGTFVQNARTYTQGGTGAVWRFTNKHVHTTTSNPNTVYYYVSTVTYPNGEVISYSYDTALYAGYTYYRPNKISSNRGYFIAITYQGSTFPSNDWNAPASATLYASSAPTVALRQLTYGGGTITEIAGASQRAYSCTGCPNSMGANLERNTGSLTLPTEASPTLQVTPVPNEQVIGTVTRDGVTWNYAYANLRWDGGAHLYDTLTVTGPDNFRNVYSYGTWRLSSTQLRLVLTGVTDSIGRSTSYTFDDASRPTRITYPEGNRVDVAYDEFGNIVSRTATPKAGSGLSAVAETAFYPTADTSLCVANFVADVRCYRPLWSRDGLGRQTDYVYNDSGQVIQQDDPADATGVRRRTITEYALSGTGISRPVVVRVCGVGTTCGTNQEIRTEYQYLGDTPLPTLVRQVDPATGAALATTYSYDAEGRLLSEDGPLAGDGDARYYRYDAFGRRTFEIGGTGASGARPATRYAYRTSDDKVLQADAGSLPSATSTTFSMLHRTNHGYDNQRNNIFEWVTQSGVTRTFVQRTFQASGRLQCEARRMNPATFGSLPSSACTLGAQGTGSNDFGPDRITRNVYDAAGQLLQVQRGYSTSLQQNYATYTYSPNGQRRTVTDANGNKAELRYDGFDRLVRWVFPSRTSPGALNEADYESYTYDAVGNRLSLRKRDGKTITFLYDNLNRVTRKTVPASASGAAGYSVFYGYDLRNAQTYARFGSTTGQGITSTYDPFGRLLTSTSNMGGTARTLTYRYDSGSRRDRLTMPDGVWFGYGHDPGGRLTSIADQAGATVATFGYDAAGRPTSGNASSAATTYTYDPVSRLATLTHNLAGTAADQTLTFGYNPASQIVSRATNNNAYVSNTAYDVSRSYSVNGLNQYTAAGPATFAYDANGNLSSDGSTSFVYDTENRLVSASGGYSATLSYDPLGRLFQTTGGGVTTRFLYDGDELVAEYTSTGTLLRRYVHGTGLDDPVLWYEGVGVTATQRRGLTRNHQGSIVAVADGSGNMVQINAYDPWGIPNPTNAGRFGYTGQIWLSEIGMWHYKARLYSPTLGRFLQTDPVGYEDDVNLYAYVGNDPINLADSTGESCDTGSRLGEAAQCRVDMDYMQMDFSSDPSRGPHGPRAYGGGGNSEWGILRRTMDDVEETATNVSDLATMRMRETRGRGRTGEAVVREALEAGGFRILGSQVHIRDIEGNLRIVDFIVAGGPSGMLGVEVKYDRNTRGVRQRTIDARIRLQGGRVVSRNQQNFTYGQRVQFGTIEINPRLVRVP